MFWGDLDKMEILTIHDTNYLNVGLVLSIRLTSFFVMVWLLYEDQVTKGTQYSHMTTWGSHATIVTFALLILCSIQ